MQNMVEDANSISPLFGQMMTSALNNQLYVVIDMLEEYAQSVENTSKNEDDAEWHDGYMCGLYRIIPALKEARTSITNTHE